MEFGICFKGFVEPERARALVRQAENAGFTYCWFYDSHILWRESFVAMARCMEHTTNMRFGPLVTNPNSREWSVAASLFGSLAKPHHRQPYLQMPGPWGHTLRSKQAVHSRWPTGISQVPDTRRIALLPPVSDL